MTTTTCVWLPNTQKATHVDEKLFEVIHKLSLVEAIDDETGAGRRQASKRLHQATVAGRVLREQVIHQLSVVILVVTAKQPLQDPQSMSCDEGISLHITPLY